MTTEVKKNLFVTLCSAISPETLIGVQEVLEFVVNKDYPIYPAIQKDDVVYSVWFNKTQIRIISNIPLEAIQQTAIAPNGDLLNLGLVAILTTNHLLFVNWDFQVFDILAHSEALFHTCIRDVHDSSL